ncbi:MAG: HAD hydrolase family protein [Phycisphaerae bacterium]
MSMTKVNPSIASVISPPAKMKSQRLIVCDLDGTLIGRDHKINPADVAALAEARAAGCAVSICTGRSISEALDIIAPLNLSGPGVFVTGAAICDLANGATLHRHTMEPHTVQMLLEFFGVMGHAVLLLIDTPDSPGPRYMMTSNGPIHAASEDWFIRNKMPALMVKELDGGTLANVLRLGIVADLPRSAEITERLTSQFKESINFLALKAPEFECHVIEVFAANVDKWTGVRSLCTMLNIDCANAIPIGDDINDLPMLRNARLSFAMGNAAPAVQHAAKRVTRSQVQAGVAAAVREILS